MRLVSAHGGFGAKSPVLSRLVRCWWTDERHGPQASVHSKDQLGTFCSLHSCTFWEPWQDHFEELPVNQLRDSKAGVFIDVQVWSWITCKLHRILKFELLHSRTRKVGVGYCQLRHKGQKEWANGSKVARFDKILGEIDVKLYTTKSLLIPPNWIHPSVFETAAKSSVNLWESHPYLSKSYPRVPAARWCSNEVSGLWLKSVGNLGGVEGTQRIGVGRSWVDFSSFFFCQKNEKASETWNSLRVTLSPGPGTQLQEAAKTTKHTSFLPQR